MANLPSLAHFPVPFFPPVASAWREPDGLLAWGGDLSVPRLLAGYQRGIFPWFSAEDRSHFVVVAFSADGARPRRAEGAPLLG